MLSPEGRDLLWLAATVELEAASETYEGKLAVAHVIMNRVDPGSGKSVTDIVMAPQQFSCWNTGEPSRMRLDVPPSRDSLRAACVAYFYLTPDPTKGATHYLNPELTRKQRGGSLPKWYDANKVTAVIGLHHFLKL